MSQKSLQTTNAESPKGLKKINNLQELQQKLLTVGFYGGAAFLGYQFGLKPYLKKARRDQEKAGVMVDPDKQQATILHNAMNPSGVKWMRAMDQTDEEEIFNAARKIKDWAAVQASYQNLYSRDLLNDLQSELDTQEYQSFIRIIQNGMNTTSTSSGSTSQKGMIVASTKAVRLRSTPDSSPGAYSFNTNILSTIQANKFLGWTTGKRVVDNNGVKYYEIMIHFKEDIPSGTFKSIYRKQDSRTLRFWVGAGAIQQFRHYKQLLANGIKLYKGVSDVGLRKNFK
jgi:hypothetical protein